MVAQPAHASAVRANAHGHDARRQRSRGTFGMKKIVRTVLKTNEGG